MRTGTRNEVSASRKIHLSFQAGEKTAGPRRSVLLHTPPRQRYSGIPPSDIYKAFRTHNPQLTTPSPPQNITGFRAAAERTRGMMLTDVKGQWWLPQQYFCLFRLSCFLSSLVIFDIFLFPVTGLLY